MKKVISVALMCSVILYNVVLSGTFLDVAYAKESAKANKQEAERMYKEHIKPNLKHNESEHSEEKLEELEQMDKEFEELVIELPEEIVEPQKTDDVSMEVSNITDVSISTFALSRASSIYYYDNPTCSSVVIGNSSNLSTAIFSNSGVDYKFLDKATSRFYIPGMYKTAVLDKVCDDMVPQGIEVEGNYMFITAYCSEGEHNSVIYVLDAESKEYIVTLVTGVKLHVGGIAYVNGYLWICGTYKEDENYVGNIVYYMYSQLKVFIQYAKNKGVVSVNIASYGSEEIVLNNNEKASFLTEFNGYLVVGEFYEPLLGLVNGRDLSFFHVSNLLNGNTNPTYQLSLPAKAQGVSFYKMYGDTYMTINASLGRKYDSTVYVYKSKGYASGLNLSLSCTKKITMPCLLEESIQYKGYTYYVFESCGNKYRNGTDGEGCAEYVIGQACGFSNAFILK